MSGYNAASLYGRLGKPPKRIDTKTGTPMAVASLAVTLPASQSDETVTQWFNLICVGKVAEQLLRHDQGELVSVMVNLSMNQWQQAEGETVEQLSITANSLMSVRTSRPAGGRKSNDTPRKPVVSSRYKEYHRPELDFDRDPF